MLTRQFVAHDYDPAMPARVNLPGAIMLRPAGVGTQSNIPAAMPVARPVASPSPDQGAPFYSAGSYQYRPNTLQRGGAMALTPSVPRQAMDPSDKSTWQRPYLFS